LIGRAIGLWLLRELHSKITCHHHLRDGIEDMIDKAGAMNANLNIDGISVRCSKLRSCHGHDRGTFQLGHLPLTRFFICVLMAMLLGLVTASPATAKPKADTDKSSSAAIPPDPLGRDTPRGLHTGLVAAMAEGDYARVAQFLDLGKVSEEKAQLRAKAFKHALNKSGKLDPYLQIANTAGGDVTDGLPPGDERLGEFRPNGGTEPIIAHQTKNVDGSFIWVISKQTLALVPDEIPASEADEVDHITIAGVTLLDWTKLLGIALGLYLGFTLTLLAIHKALCLLFPRAVKTAVYRFVHAAVPPLVLFVSIALMNRAAAMMNVDIVARTMLRRYAGAAGWIALIWFLCRLVNAASELFITRMREDGQVRGVEILTFCRRLAIAILVALGIAILLATFGIDVTAGIAALGIGGLALALGARKAVEDLVGSIAIIADQPVKVGDHCKVDHVEGFVLDIGMRSTRIRSLDSAIVSIPNSHFAGCTIENLSARDRFFVLQKFGIVPTAGAAKAEAVLNMLREQLAKFPEAIPRPDAVRFLGFGESSLDFQIRTWLQCTSHSAGRLLQEKLLIQILREIEKLGVEIALPGRMLQISRTADGVPQNPDMPSDKN
jgi:MscS family membrane protein